MQLRCLHDLWNRGQPLKCNFPFWNIFREFLAIVYRVILCNLKVRTETKIKSRGGTWRERVTRTRMRITLILYNFPESSTFCEIFTFKFHSVYADCRRLREIVQDSAINFYFSESCQPSCNVKRRRRRLPVFVKILCIYLWN